MGDRGEMTTQRAYLLPADPDPADMVCLQVYVPNDPAFLRALFGSLDYLGTWLAWERDAAKTGAVAAASMKAANDLTYTRWFTLGGCAEAIEPPYTEVQPDGRTPTEAAVDDWLWSIFEVIVDIDVMLGGGASCNDVVSKWGPIWTARTGQAGTSVISSLCNDMSGMTQSERDELTDPDSWEELRYEIVCSAAGYCPSLFDLSSSADWYAWMNCAAEKVYDFLNTAAGTLYDMLNDAAAFLSGSSGAQQIQSAGGGGAGFGFAPTECNIYIDFDGNDTGYTLIEATKGAFGIDSTDGIRGNLRGVFGTDLTRRCDFDVAIDRPVKNIVFRHIHEHSIGDTSSGGDVAIFDGANEVWRCDFFGAFSIQGQCQAQNTWNTVVLIPGGVYGTRIEFRVGRVDVGNPTKCDVDNILIELAS